jgi:hypothetical protein
MFFVGKSTVINRSDMGEHLLRMRIIQFSSLDAGIHQQFVREQSRYSVNGINQKPKSKKSNAKSK